LVTVKLITLTILIQNPLKIRSIKEILIIHITIKAKITLTTKLKKKKKNFGLNIDTDAINQMYTFGG
jgi:hypothetical protein